MAALHALPLTPEVLRARLYNQSDTIPAEGQSRKLAVESWWLCQALAIGRWGHTGPLQPAMHVSGSRCHQLWPSHDDHDYGWSWSQPGELTDAGSAGQKLSAKTLTTMASPSLMTPLTQDDVNYCQADSNYKLCNVQYIIYEYAVQNLYKAIKKTKWKIILYEC